MSDKHSPIDAESSRKRAKRDGKRTESVNDRIDRINRNALQRIVCRPLSERGEHANR